MKVQRRRLSPEDKKQKIVDVASAQFLRLGYDNCTLDLIAARAKVGKQAIYQFFDSKEELYAHVVRTELAQRTITEPVASNSLELDLEEYLFQTIQRTAETKMQGIMRVNIMASRKHPDLAAELHLGLRQGSIGLNRFLVRLEEEGALPPLQIDPFNLATRLGGIAFEGARHFLGQEWDEGDDAAREAAKWTTGLFLHGCRCEEGAHASRDQPVLSSQTTPLRPITMRLSQDRFEDLCVTAMDEFMTNGFTGANVENIVARTGVSRATIYRQFGSKKGLFRFLIEQQIKLQSAESFDQPEAEDFGTALQALAEQILRRHLSDPSIAMHHLLIAEAVRAPDLAMMFYENLVERVRRSLHPLYLLYLGHPPCDRCVRAFHILATFGVRFLAEPTKIDDKDVRQLSREAVIIMTGIMTGQEPRKA